MRQLDVPMAADVGQPGLVRTIATRGYVTIRVEKSGVGDSEGPPCDASGYSQELEGDGAALAALTRHPAVDSDKVYLLGISLGGVFAPVLAAATPVQGIIVYGTPAAAPQPYPGRSDRARTGFRHRTDLEQNRPWHAPVPVTRGRSPAASVGTRSVGVRSPRLPPSEAVAEISVVARHKLVAAEGAVVLIERLSPALENVDSSSGAIGSAVNHAIDALAQIIASAPADPKTRDRWLVRLWDGYQADRIPYIETFGDYWGDLCGSPAVAARWADELIGPCRLAFDPDPSVLRAGVFFNAGKPEWGSPSPGPAAVSLRDLAAQS